MLDNYKIGQPVLYNMLNNALCNNKLSHAYIFDSNNNADVMDIVMSFVKEIICMDIDSEEKIVNICQRIDDGNYLDVKVIEADGLWIKKEQLLNLQSEFSKKAVEGSKKVYIVKAADKMNQQTANSILKFLEEPVDDIIAILIVDNLNLLLSTIISRCQVIKLNKKKYEDSTILNFNNLVKNTEYDAMSDEDKNKIIYDVWKFISFIENNGLDTLIYTKSLWHNNFKDRNIMVIAMDLMLNFYYDVIRYMSKLEVQFFCDRAEDIKIVASKNSIISVTKKIEYIDEARNNIRKNFNINLLIDKLIIEMCGDE